MRKATTKDMTAIREKTLPFASAIKDQVSGADLKDHGGTASVHIRWNLNSAAERDRIFLLEINGQKAYLDVEELMSYTRLV